MDKRERGRAMIDWLVYNHFASSRGDLALKLGYNPTVLSASITGRNPFSDKMGRKICAFNKRLNIEWFLTGEGEMLIPENGIIIRRKTTSGSKSMSSNSGPSLHPGVRMVPFYHELLVSAGQTDIFGYDTASSQMYVPGVDAEAFFPVTGMSMLPHIMPGDIIGVKTVDSLERIDPTRIYMIITRQNERMIKHILPCQSGDAEITLVSDNSEYPAFKIMKDDILKVMRVVYVGRQI